MSLPKSYAEHLILNDRGIYKNDGATTNISMKMKYLKNTDLIIQLKVTNISEEDKLSFNKRKSNLF